MTELRGKVYWHDNNICYYIGITTFEIRITKQNFQFTVLIAHGILVHRWKKRNESLENGQKRVKIATRFAEIRDTNLQHFPRKKQKIIGKIPIK